ncbi:hypothetical protein DFH29DRAFT_877703 [Suillus ampliporus]|nr:hypothetical protein DFH29DRAFT_877703 [Suillus ampliporus]
MCVVLENWEDLCSFFAPELVAHGAVVVKGGTSVRLQLYSPKQLLDWTWAETGKPQAKPLRREAMALLIDGLRTCGGYLPASEDPSHCARTPRTPVEDPRQIPLLHPSKLEFQVTVNLISSFVIVSQQGLSTMNVILIWYLLVGLSISYSRRPILGRSLDVLSSGFNSEFSFWSNTEVSPLVEAVVLKLVRHVERLRSRGLVQM